MTKKNKGDYEALIELARGSICLTFGIDARHHAEHCEKRQRQHAERGGHPARTPTIDGAVRAPVRGNLRRQARHHHEVRYDIGDAQNDQRNPHARRYPPWGECPCFRYSSLSPSVFVKPINQPIKSCMTVVFKL